MICEYRHREIQEEAGARKSINQHSTERAMDSGQQIAGHVWRIYTALQNDKVRKHQLSILSHSAKVAQLKSAETRLTVAATLRNQGALGLPVLLELSDSQRLLQKRWCEAQPERTVAFGPKVLRSFDRVCSYWRLHTQRRRKWSPNRDETWLTRSRSENVVFFLFWLGASAWLES